MSVTMTHERMPRAYEPCPAPRTVHGTEEDNDPRSVTIERAKGVLGEDAKRVIEIRRPATDGSVAVTYRGDETAEEPRPALAGNHFGQIKIDLRPHLVVTYALRPKRRSEPGAGRALASGQRPLPGWVLVQYDRRRKVRTVVSCCTAEPYAFLDQFGLGEEVVEITREAIATFRYGAERERRLADRLAHEVREALAGERIGLRAIQQALIAELELGVHLVTLCTRGRGTGGRGEYVGVNGKPDTTWLQRRAGLKLVETGAGDTRRQLYSLTATREVATQLARVCELAPVDLGL